MKLSLWEPQQQSSDLSELAGISNKIGCNIRLSFWLDLLMKRSTRLKDCVPITNWWERLCSMYSRDPTLILVSLKIFTPMIQEFWHTSYHCTFSQSCAPFVWSWGGILRRKVDHRAEPQYSPSTSNKKRTGLTEATILYIMSKFLYHWCQYFE